MPSDFPYASLVNYSPRGTSDISQTSRRFRGALKAGRLDAIRQTLGPLRSPAAAGLTDFLNPNVTLVPIPGSAPLAPGAVWPSRVICDFLVAEGFGESVLPCISRTYAVRKSATSPASERLLVHEHCDSLAVETQLVSPAAITLVDDVVTLGRTSFACAQLVAETFPQAEIRIFAMLRTQGRIPDIEQLVDPSVGIITGYDSGKTFRDP